jgi:hypothetical protein
MNHIPYRHITAALTGLACACLGLAAAPTAFAQDLSSPGYPGMPAAWVREALLHGEDLAPATGPGSTPSAIAPTVTRTVVMSGMPGWQIALIVIGTALLAAAAAVLLDRTWAARRRPDNSIRAAISSRPGQVVDDLEFGHGRAEIPGDDADLIGTADPAVPHTRRTLR